MTFTDFPNGLSGPADYLSSQNSLVPELSGSITDIDRFVISAEIDNNLREIICSLLAGRGLKLPNIQICINLNLSQLTDQLTGVVSQALSTALSSLTEAFGRFMDHLNLNEVMGRINGVLGQISNIANMINFCSAPIDPIQIPNVLENAMSSFLGQGMDIMNRIGSIAPENIGGCLLDGGFNDGIWNGGLLQTISENLDNLNEIEDSIIGEIGEIVTEIDNLIESETGVPTTYDNGGSDLAENPRDTWTGIGVLFNANDEGIQGAVSNGGAIWSAYQQLGSYQVQDSDGNTYNNIFELFVDDDLLRILRRSPNPTPEISTTQPVYNYCGEVIGYTKDTTQGNPNTSVGAVPEPIAQPGFNAGGLPTNPRTEALAAGLSASGASVTQQINNVTNVDGVIVAADIDELLNLNTVQNQVVYLQSTNTVYFNNGGTSNTINDFTAIGSGTDTVTKDPDTGFVGHGQTINATPVEILFDFNRKTPGSGKSWFVEILAIANRANSSDTTAIKIEGLVDNNSGTISVLGTSGNKTVYNSTTNTLDYDLLLDVVGSELRVRVQGDTGHTVSWTVKFKYVEA